VTPEIGTEVPGLVRTIDLPAMVAYAGATWDWHRLHYDTGYAAERGLPGPVVDGQVFGALLAQMLRQWLGPDATLRSMSFRLAAPVFAWETVRCSGRVTGVDGRVVEVSLRVDVVDAGGAALRTAVSPASAQVEVGAGKAKSLRREAEQSPTVRRQAEQRPTPRREAEQSRRVPAQTASAQVDVGAVEATTLRPQAEQSRSLPAQTTPGSER